MKPTHALLLGLVLITVASSCKKSSKSGGDTDPGLGGFYAVYSMGPQYISRKGVQWQDGRGDTLVNSGTNIYLTDVAVTDNGNVLAAGCECTTPTSTSDPNLHGDCRILFWKDKVKQTLTSTLFNGLTKVLVEAGPSGEPYVVGTEAVGPAEKGVIRLWRNGQRSDVTNGSKDAAASCLFVSGSDVYIGGWEKDGTGVGPTKAMLWKNGVPKALTGLTTLGEVVGVQVSGGDVYAAVIEDNTKAWVSKNGVKLASPSNLESVEDILLVANDLYILGVLPGESTSTVWKNGVVLHKLAVSGPSTRIVGQKLAVKEGVVYVSGYVEKPGPAATAETGLVWKNGAVLQSLGSSYVVNVPGFVVK